MPNGTKENVDGSVLCNTDTFQKDPTSGLTDTKKQCVCESQAPIAIHKTKFCAEEGGTCACENDGKVVYSSFDGFINKESI